jgi:anaerobic dimethyl sulfoxide reductase subunit A
VVAFNTIRWHKAINLQPQLQSGQITLAQFNAQIDALASAPAVNPKMLFWNSSPDAAIGVFGANERVAAIKQTFAYLFVWKSPNTHASRYFDIILPSTEIYMEEPGDGTNGINRFLSNGSSTYNNAFIYAAPAVTPLGEARPQEWMYTMLAKRFGVDKTTDPVVSALFTQDQWDPVAWNNAMDSAHQSAYNTWAASSAIAPLNPPTWAQFKQNPIFRVPAITVGPYASWINASPPQNPWSGTASGKIEASSSFLVSPSAQTTLLPGGSAGQVIGYVGSGGTAIPTWVDKLAYTFVDSRASTYPLCLITPQSYYRHHSAGFLNPYLNGDCYQHRLWMSVPDATARGITDGAQVHIFSDGGEEIVPAYVTSRMTPGTVALYHGGYYTPSSEKTALMPDGIDMGGDPNFLMTDIMPDKTISDPCIGSGPVQVELYLPPNGSGVVTTSTTS